MASWLARRLRECELPEEVAERMTRCISQVQEAICICGCDWSVIPIGDFASGFRNAASDMDLTCSRQGNGGDPLPPSLAARDLQWMIRPPLMRCSNFTMLHGNLSEKAPRLKMRFEGLLDVNLSCHNIDAVRNTRLLRAYARLDSGISDFGRAVKLWASAAKIIGTAEGNLSSQTLMMMAIYSLQVDEDLHLPCLPLEAFVEGGLGEADPRMMEVCALWGWPEAALDPLRLLARFLKFFAEEFSWGREVVSVRLGRRCNARDTDISVLQFRDAARIHIEDPYRLGRNLHQELTVENEERLREALRDADRTMRAGGRPMGLQPTDAGAFALPYLYDENDKAKYIMEKLNPILEDMIADVLHVMPEDPAGFMRSWLERARAEKQGSSISSSLFATMVDGLPRDDIIQGSPPLPLERSYSSRWALCPDDDAVQMLAEPFREGLFAAGFDAKDATWINQLTDICRERGQPEDWLFSEEISQGVARSLAEHWDMYDDRGIVVCVVEDVEAAMPVGQLLLVYKVDDEGRCIYGQRVRNRKRPLQSSCDNREWVRRADFEPVVSAYEGMLCTNAAPLMRNYSVTCSCPRRKPFPVASSRFKSQRDMTCTEFLRAVEATRLRVPHWQEPPRPPLMICDLLPVTAVYDDDSGLRDAQTRKAEEAISASSLDSRGEDLTAIDFANNGGWSPVVETRVIRGPISGQWRLIHIEPHLQAGRPSPPQGPVPLP